MVPFGQVDDDFFVVLVCVWVLRVGDDEGASHTVHVLALTMRVVPEGTDLVRHSEVVGEGLARRNFTLGQAGNTIHLVGMVLEQPVKVHRGVGNTQAVVEFNYDTVTLCDVDVRPRVFAVAADNIADFSEAVRILRYVGSIPLEMMCLCEDKAGQRGQRKQRAGELHGGVGSGCTRGMDKREAVATTDVADPRRTLPAGNVSGIYTSSLLCSASAAAEKRTGMHGMHTACMHADTSAAPAPGTAAAQR